MRLEAPLGFLAGLLLAGPATATAATSCGFDRAALAFAGSPLEQARCLLRHVLPGGELSPPLATLPPPLEDLIDRPVAIPAGALARYLALRGIPESEIGGPLTDPLSQAGDNCPDFPTARYFVIHDTSTPALCEAPAFPADMDTPDWRWNRRETWADYPQAHLFLTRDGRGIAPQGRTFQTPWRATKLERPREDTRLKGLFLHIENVQPRRAEADTDFPVGGSPDLRFYRWDTLEAGWVCRSDRIGPEPGLSDPQLDRLALVYTAASVRRGSWLIPAFHATVDAGIPEAHDDPQNFDLARWAARLGALLAELQGKSPQ